MGDVLRRYWHPVASVANIREQPYAAQLLGEPIVLYKANGKVVAFEDLCLHRGTRLSLGYREGENLVCAYHGWTYAPSGKCVRIPSLAPEQAIPPKAKVKAYKVDERYGLVWVCLGDPVAPIPEFPAADFPKFESPGSHTYALEFEWNVNAARMTENSMDHSHFPFIHPGILGDASRPMYPDVEVEFLPDGLRYVIVNHANNSIRYYRLTLPFSLEISVVDQADPSRKWAQFFPCCPVTPRETRLWFIAVRNFDVGRSDYERMEFDRDIFLQDRRIVENQFPEELPIDITEELHLKGPDKAALEYRRLLAKIGVEW